MFNSKEVAGRRAAELVEDGMRLGLGTGSTVHFTLERLAERIAQEGLTVQGVPTSRDTEAKARSLAIPLIGLEETESLDLAIDGADEVDGAFDMIKGGGGALLREKVVASIARSVAIVVGPDKIVARLGRAFLLPIEVVPFARPVVSRALRRLGCEPSLRLVDQGRPYPTDNGNEILDCRFADGIENPRALEEQLRAIPGIVESGLFIGLADLIVVGHPNGEAELRSKP